MLEIRDLSQAAPVVVPADTTLITCAHHLLAHPDWRMLVAVDDGEVKGLVDDMAVFGLGVMLKDGLWYAFETEGPDIAGTVARPAPVVEASTPAGTALRRLKGQSALVLVEKGEVVGLITENDVMHVAPAVIPADRRVDESASRPVISVPSDTSAQSALQTMGEHRVRHLAIVDDGVLKGVATLRDVVAGWVTPHTDVERVMASAPLTVALGTSLKDAATLMAERDVGCLPVVDGDGQAVAILTRSDIVSALADTSDDEDLFG
jgi:CBS domain-containing protein